MIKLVNVSKYYSSNDVIALGLRKVNLEFHLNEFVAVVGESGSGKTTLLNVISGIDSYEEGEMYINDKETSYFSVEDMENYRKKYVAFVFQNYNLIDAYTVLQNVEAPLILSGYPKEKIKQRALEIIKKVGLEDHIHHKATKLSGGQKQRVVIARALAKDCPIIAADEPTGNLDSTSAKGIIELLHEISKEKLVIVVTHDFNQLQDYATRKIRIYDGEIVEDRTITKVEKENLPEIEDKEYNIKFIEFLKMALRNLLSVPKKTLLMIVIFTFFSTFVALAYGAYYVSVGEGTATNNYYFNFTGPTRVVVKKTDNSAFTQADLDQLAGYDKVRTVLPFDYVMDVDLWGTLDRSQFYLRTSSLSYMPLSLITQSSLDAGTMPTSDNEIVLAVSKAELTDADKMIGLKLNVININDYSGDPQSGEGYTITGFIDKAKIYATNDNYSNAYILLNDDGMNKVRKETYLAYANEANFTSSYTVDQKVISTIDTYKYSSNIILDPTLGSKQMVESRDRSGGVCGLADSCTTTGSFYVSDTYTSKTIDNVTVTYTTDVTKYETVRVSQDIYDAIYYDDVYQVSLIAKNDVDVKGLFRSVQNIDNTNGEQKYDAIYPYDSQASNSFSALQILLMNIGLISLIVVVLIGSTLITYIIFRAIINTKLHDYAIFRTIGANRKFIKYFIYLENLYVVLISYVIFLIITLSLPDSITINTGLFYALKVFTLPRYLIFFILEIIMSLIISRRYCNRIFKESVNRTLKTSIG